MLATSIAETSLTIEGIRIVIDGGLARGPRFDPSSGMTRLVTSRVSQAASAQRAGRAGRLAPGIAYRLWPEREQAQLPPYAPPEIREADLAPLLLTLAASGNSDPAALSWLDPPPAAALAQARTLLIELGALDEAGRITKEGEAIAALPLHPRLAHMALTAKARGQGRLACAIAALLMERDIVRAAPQARDADLRLRIDLMNERDAARSLPPGLSLDRGGLQRTRDAARQIERQIRVKNDESIDPAETGSVLALAYPDRIAQSRGATGQFRLASGGGAELPASDPLAKEEFIAVAELDGARKTARIFLAAPLSRAAIDEDFADRIVASDTIAWDTQSEAVLARRQRRLDALILDDQPLRDAPTEQVTAALLTGIRELGLAALPWSSDAQTLRARIAFLHRTLDDEWPDFSDAALTRESRRLASALSHRHHAARAIQPDRSRRSARGAARLRPAPPARRARADPYRGAERLAHRHRLRRRRRAGACREAARDVRRDHDAGNRPRQNAAARPSALARRPAAASDARPREFLEECLSADPRRDARPLSETPLARRPTHRAADGKNEAAKLDKARLACLASETAQLFRDLLLVASYAKMPRRPMIIS